MQQDRARGAFAPCPLFVDLDGVHVVVVGGGKVASRKIESLISYGAAVTVVAPQAVAAIEELAANGRIEFVRRRYSDGDVSGARLVVCATDDEAVNRSVYDEAVAAGALVNVVDVPQLCNTIVPSVIRRGKLQVAVSTAGAAPSVARRLRLELEERFEGYWEDYLDTLAQVRCMVKERVPGSANVRRPLYEALSCEDIEKRFAAGERPSAQVVYDTYIAPIVQESTL